MRIWCVSKHETDIEDRSNYPCLYLRSTLEKAKQTANLLIDEMLENALVVRPGFREEVRAAIAAVPESNDATRIDGGSTWLWIFPSTLDDA